jgi:hypothetical protein
VTPTEAGVEVALYGELGALLELAEARKTGRPGSLGPRSLLSVVAGARNHLYRTKFIALSTRRPILQLFSGMVMKSEAY